MTDTNDRALEGLRYINVTLPNGDQFTLTLDHAKVNEEESTLEAVCKYRVVAKSTWTPDALAK